MFPKLAEELAQEYIKFDNEDVIAEIQFALNSQLFYSGFSPYEVLYGANPNPIWTDETESINQLGSEGVAFYEHQIVRAKAIAIFHQSLLISGLARVNHARPRTTEQQLFVPGQWVDVWRKPKNKNHAAWRGPCVVVALLGSGFITVRWQSVYYDVPIHHARPHFFQTPAATLENSGQPVVPAVKDADKAETPAIADSAAATVSINKANI